MNKTNKINNIIIAISAILVIGFCTFLIMNHKTVSLKDCEKVKQEYEKINEATIKETKKKLINVNIDKENPFIYKTPKQIVSILNKENCLVFFGDAKDNWCRNAIETLIKAAKNNKIDKIYYVDIFGIRDEFVFNGSIEPKQTKKGMDAYYKMVDFFGDNLKEYYVPDPNGNLYDTGVKRLYAPTFALIENGKVKGFHEFTVLSHRNPNEKITEEQEDELFKIYDKIIKSKE